MNNYEVTFSYMVSKGTEYERLIAQRCTVLAANQKEVRRMMKEFADGFEPEQKFKIHQIRKDDSFMVGSWPNWMTKVKDLEHTWNQPDSNMTPHVVKQQSVELGKSLVGIDQSYLAQRKDYPQHLREKYANKEEN